MTEIRLGLGTVSVNNLLRLDWIGLLLFCLFCQNNSKSEKSEVPSYIPLHHFTSLRETKKSCRKVPYIVAPKDVKFCYISVESVTFVLLMFIWGC